MAFSDMVELYLEDKKKHVKLKTYLRSIEDLYSSLGFCHILKIRLSMHITAVDITTVARLH